MKHRAARTTMATLSLLAYVWGGLGVGSQFVYCVGSDGHSGIERAHGPSHDAVPREENSALSSKSCLDVSLLVPASKEQERLRDLSPALQHLVSTVLSHVSLGDPRFTRGDSPDVNREKTISLRSTVLRI